MGMGWAEWTEWTELKTTGGREGGVGAMVLVCVGVAGGMGERAERDSLTCATPQHQHRTVQSGKGRTYLRTEAKQSKAKHPPTHQLAPTNLHPLTPNGLPYLLFYISPLLHIH